VSKALYRKYRSKQLSEVVGQNHITDVLSRALTSGKTAHAYLLTGPRGVGKTSIARIIAHEINQLPYDETAQHLDIIEIDAASNNGIDDVRELREKAMLAPAKSPKKVYIIDEVHMLSKPAFNALLKILEEPPEHVVFILATTDFDKLPATIVSRTQRFHFRFVPEEAVVDHLRFIAKQENISIEDDALKLIANRGGGSFRDSISLLDQLQHSSGKTITAQAIESTLGLASQADIDALYTSLTDGEAPAIIARLDQLEQQGVSAATLGDQLASKIKANLASVPYLASKLEPLLALGKSPHPSVGLLVILLDGIKSVPPKTKSVSATAAPAPYINVAPVLNDMPLETTPPVQTAAPKPIKKPKPAMEAASVQPSAPPEIATLTEELFDWQKVLAAAKQHEMTFYTTLNRCVPEVKNGKLILYAGKKFHKTKLDGPNYRPIISQCLQTLGIGDILVEIVGTPPPPKDAALAKVAAMMGGGEEVDV
jgi:DNA polymerase-3 subunit gamma/tau